MQKGKKITRAIFRKKNSWEAFITNINAYYKEIGIKIGGNWYKDKLTDKESRIKNQKIDHPGHHIYGHPI